ncbi:MAG: winged helix-turn-helix domain-containing protein [Spirochaetota bacterium]
MHERIKVYCKRQKLIQIIHSEKPCPEEGFHVYISPVEDLHLLLSPGGRPKTWLPVIGYGDSSLLPYAFLSGCADYLKNPWTPEELYLRTRQYAKRTHIDFPWGSIHFSKTVITSHIGSEELTIQEFNVLNTLATQRGNTVPREVLYYSIWGCQGFDSRVVDMHISNLRKKLNRLVPLHCRGIIKTSRKIGYYIP